MTEKIVGVIEDVQTKPPGSWTQKSCDLIFTDRRMLCVKVGASSFVAGVAGAGLAGPSGAMVFTFDSQHEQEENRENSKDKTLDELLAMDKSNYSIDYTDIREGTFKTGFLSTLGMMAPLNMKTEGGAKYFYNIYNNQKEYAKSLIEATMPNVKT